ncbi:AIM24 family protein [Lentzea tibetensis]|uniref:AIM24 family protein n=1 Tax=Lentzea tibetensis TaxID=2591470 RepID=A0A563EED0_9PSEU|nr:AIM24 family protein [Lentzea tibetensis]TWP43327.1 AIM24 family protein [Lentzea tibetensis]
MQVRTRHTPTFGVARLVLAPDEMVLVDPATVLATSYGLGYERKGKGSTLVGLCTAGREGGWVDVAPAFPGDLHVLELDGKTGWCYAKLGWLGSGSTVLKDAEAPPLKALFGGGEGFLNYAHGQGSVVLACCGTLDVVTLTDGELVTLASDHVVAFADSVQCRLRAAAQDGPQSIRTGEGLVFDFAGPGVVLTQTRGPRQLVNWLRANGVSSRS